MSALGQKRSFSARTGSFEWSGQTAWKGAGRTQNTCYASMRPLSPAPVHNQMKDKGIGTFLERTKALFGVFKSLISLSDFSGKTLSLTGKSDTSIAVIA
jgi:hypothetical protein